MGKNIKLVVLKGAVFVLYFVLVLAAALAAMGLLLMCISSMDVETIVLGVSIATGLGLIGGAFLEKFRAEFDRRFPLDGTKEIE